MNHVSHSIKPSSDARVERIALPRAGFSTRLFVSGAGAPVLLLHGNPHSAAEWRFVSAALGDRAWCLAPDLPGFGASDEPPSAFDYSHQAHEAFLDDVLAAKRVKEPVVLVVHDIGGVVGIPWAAKRKDKVRGVVITNTVIFEQFPWFPIAHTWKQKGGIGRARAELGMWLVGRFGGALFRRILAKTSPDLSPEEIALIVKEFALDPKSKRSTLRLFQQMVPPAYFDAAAAMLRDLYASMPTRVVWGLGDLFIDDRYAHAFPAAGRRLVEGGGHWMPIHHAEMVAAAVIEILAEARS